MHFWSSQTCQAVQELPGADGMGMPVPREAARGLPSARPVRQVLQLWEWGETQTTDPNQSLSLVVEPVIFWPKGKNTLNQASLN